MLSHRKGSASFLRRLVFSILTHLSCLIQCTDSIHQASLSVIFDSSSIALGTFRTLARALVRDKRTKDLANQQHVGDTTTNIHSPGATLFIAIGYANLLATGYSAKLKQNLRVATQYQGGRTAVEAPNIPYVRVGESRSYPSFRLLATQKWLRAGGNQALYIC